MKLFDFKKGFGLVEIIVGVAVVSVSIFSLLAVFIFASRLADENLKNVQASFLIEEGLETVRFLRDSGWQTNIVSLAASADYYLEFTEGKWKATTTNIYIDDFFERKLKFDEVYRDNNDDIAPSGVPDSNTRKLTVYVSWQGRNATSTKSISAYITNLFTN